MTVLKSSSARGCMFTNSDERIRRCTSLRNTSTLLRERCCKDNLVITYRIAGTVDACAHYPWTNSHRIASCSHRMLPWIRTDNILSYYTGNPATENKMLQV